MSSEIASKAPRAKSSPFATLDERLGPWEQRLDRLSDWLNPILVKESRQALKSRQFLTTFSLVLIACWGWSMLGVALQSPNIFYVPGGRYMLVGYFLIQNFPLCIIIPFAAYRSLAAEREDGTYELLQISALRPMQIVGGKLGSAALQMMIYLSVLAPCMTFTYLLRGVDILLVLSLVLWSALACGLLCCFGLLLATLMRARHLQVLVSVFLVLMLGGFCLATSAGVSAMISEGAPIPFAEPEYWIGFAAAVTAVVATAAMFLLAAAARITNRSENRATPLRMGMVVYQLLLLGWCARYWFCFGEEAVLAIYVFLACSLWAVFGAMMTGESPQLSPRARRGLPATTFGKMFLTLFYPGPGTGYVFAVVNLFVVVAAVMGMSATKHAFSWPRSVTSIMACAWTAAAYGMFYLGVNRLLVRAFSRRSPPNPGLGLLTGVLLVLLGAFIPLTVQFSFRQLMSMRMDYTVLQLPNVFWTLVEVSDTGSLYGPGWNAITWVILGFGALVFLINLLLMPTQLDRGPSPVPARVLEDEAAGQPAPLSTTAHESMGRMTAGWALSVGADGMVARRLPGGGNARLFGRPVRRFRGIGRAGGWRSPAVTQLLHGKACFLRLRVASFPRISRHVNYTYGAQRAPWTQSNGELEMSSVVKERNHKGTAGRQQDHKVVTVDTVIDARLDHGHHGHGHVTPKEAWEAARADAA